MANSLTSDSLFSVTAGAVSAILLFRVLFVAFPFLAVLLVLLNAIIAAIAKIPMIITGIIVFLFIVFFLIIYNLISKKLKLLPRPSTSLILNYTLHIVK